jgi:uncharacterized protein (DUF3084 family)
MTIANPIYDTVFKYLLEDLDIAKGLLSVILNTEIVELSVQPKKPLQKQNKTTSQSVFIELTSCKKMDVEGEFDKEYQELERKYGSIIAQKDQELEQKDQELEQKDQELAERDRLIEELKRRLND